MLFTEVFESRFSRIAPSKHLIATLRSTLHLSKTTLYPEELSAEAVLGVLQSGWREVFAPEVGLLATGLGRASIVR